MVSVQEGRACPLRMTMMTMTREEGNLALAVQWACSVGGYLCILGDNRRKDSAEMSLRA